MPPGHEIRGEQVSERVSNRGPTPAALSATRTYEVHIKNLMGNLIRRPYHKGEQRARLPTEERHISKRTKHPT